MIIASLSDIECFTPLSSSPHLGASTADRIAIPRRPMFSPLSSFSFHGGFRPRFESVPPVSQSTLHLIVSFVEAINNHWHKCDYAQISQTPCGNCDLCVLRSITSNIYYAYKENFSTKSSLGFRFSHAFHFIPQAYLLFPTIDRLGDAAGLLSKHVSRVWNQFRGGNAFEYLIRPALYMTFYHAKRGNFTITKMLLNVSQDFPMTMDTVLSILEEICQFHAGVVFSICLAKTVESGIKSSGWDYILIDTKDPLWRKAKCIAAKLSEKRQTGEWGSHDRCRPCIKCQMEKG